MKKAKRPRSIFFRIVIACLAILLAGFCVLEAIIITGGRSSKDQSGDALIVLGAQVYHSGPSPVLKQRLQAALDYMENGPRQAYTPGGTVFGTDLCGGNLCLPLCCLWSACSGGVPIICC